MPHAIAPEKDHFPYVIFHFSFVIAEKTMNSVINEKWKMENDIWKMDLPTLDTASNKPQTQPIASLDLPRYLI